MKLAEQPAFRLIAPFLGPVMALLEDPSVTEVMINPDAVFVERYGRLEAVPTARLRPLQVHRAALAIARGVGDDITEERPLLDARLPDGSRVAAVLPPCSFGGPAVTIRKFSQRGLSLDDLTRMGTLGERLAARLREGRRASKQHSRQRRHRYREDHVSCRNRPPDTPGPTDCRDRGHH